MGAAAAIVAGLTLPPLLSVPGLGKLTYNTYTVIKVEGTASLKYQTNYSADEKENKTPPYELDMGWTLLSKGTVIRAGSGVIIQTGPWSVVDLLLDDGMVVRITEKTTMRFDEDPKRESPIQVFLTRGRALFYVVFSKLNKFRSGSPFKLEAETPTAVCGVRGTFFSVVYEPTTTEISLLEGVLGVADRQKAIQGYASGTWYELKEGQAIQLPQDGSAQQRDLSSEEKKILMEQKADMDEGQLTVGVIERVKQMWAWGLSFDVFNKIRIKRTNYEIRAIISEIYTRALFSGACPDTLSDKSLPHGGIEDSWGNPYLYIRCQKNRAVVVSAGPDGTYGTADDLYRFFELDRAKSP